MVSEHHQGLAKQKINPLACFIYRCEQLKAPLLQLLSLYIQEQIIYSHQYDQQNLIKLGLINLLPLSNVTTILCIRMSLGQ